MYKFDGLDRSKTRDKAMIIAAGGGGAGSVNGGNAYARGWGTNYCEGGASGSALGTCDGASGSQQKGGDGADFEKVMSRTSTTGRFNPADFTFEYQIDGGGGGGGGLYGAAGGGMDAAVNPPSRASYHSRTSGGGGGSGSNTDPTLTDEVARVTLSWKRSTDAPVLSGGGQFHTRGVYGSWSQVGDVKSTAKFPNRAKRVAMTSSDGAEIQTLVSDNTGAIYHSIRRPDGQWTAAAAVSIGVEGLVVDVAATSSNGNAQFAAISQDGRLWHTLRFPDGRWTRAGEPLTVTGDTSVGNITSVAAVDAGWGATQFFVTTTSNQLWMLTRRADGNWAKATNVDLNGATARQVAAFVSDGETQVDIVTNNGALLHTLRHTDGTWTAPGDAANAGRITGRVTHVAAVTTQPGRGEFLVSTSDGKLTRSIRYADGSWSNPDILTTGIDLKQTVTAAAAVSLATQQLDVIAIA